LSKKKNTTTSMKRVSWIKCIKSFALMCLVATALTQLSGNPVWEVAPQKKDLGGRSSDALSLLEKPDRYLVRLEMPRRDLSQVTVNLRKGVLHVEAPANGFVPSCTRDIPLEWASSDGNLLIERQDSRGFLVVTVPKESSQTSSMEPDPAYEKNETDPCAPYPRNDTAWMMGEMQRMQREMDRMMGAMMFDDFAMPTIGHGISPHRIPGATMSSAPSLEDHGDHYVVRTPLPGQDLGKVNVSIHDRQLMIESNQNSDSTLNPCAMIAQSSFYSQSMRLPGPVQVGKMKVDRQGDELVVTLPKASGAYP
jgi:HSP20 family molecular chaperone IbpA